jgi:hypothetical protein
MNVDEARRDIDRGWTWMTVDESRRHINRGWTWMNQEGI